MGGRMAEKARCVLGQTTVEAAIALPILFILVLMLVQPAIVLYDRMVMEGAAWEGCRLLATAQTNAQGSCEAFVRRRLSAVPSVDCFHVHGRECTWRITCKGDGSSSHVSVSVSTEVKPLPLLDTASALLGLLNERGCLEVKVSATAETKSDWVQDALGGSDPGEKVGEWLHDH